MNMQYMYKPTDEFKLGLKGLIKPKKYKFYSTGNKQAYHAVKVRQLIQNILNLSKRRQFEKPVNSYYIGNDDLIKYNNKKS